nr:unnamed protein product [Digitaria exilis]
MYPAGDKEDRFQFQALSHRRKEYSSYSHPAFAYMNPWRCDELPPPPYIHGEGYLKTSIESYGIVGGGLLCISTEGVGTYCFDMASRTWVKAGDWALPFAGKIEHVPELGVLVGFPAGAEEDDQRLGVSPLPWTVSAAVDGRRPKLLEVAGDLLPPEEWKRVAGVRPQLVNLGSGKLCAVQFFQKMVYRCWRCEHAEVDRRFAVFTGLEVVRGGGDDDDEDDDEPSGGMGIRVIRHKSKRYMLPEDNNIFIKSVL